MYADDATFHKASNDPNVIQQQLQGDIWNSNRWCENNGMYINPKKTKVMLLGTAQKLNQSAESADGIGAYVSWKYMA